MNKMMLATLCVVLAGCVNKPQKPESLVTPVSAQPAAVAPQPVSPPRAEQDTSSLMAHETCRKELEALRAYGPRTYNRYAGEMAALTAKTSKFLSVKEDLNPRINELVMSAYRSRMQTLCYKIETSLGQMLVDQATANLAE
ncbi:hypothetical protein [Franconibacter helveticus]|uniref:hypothetical protein n=1 Tax=Franconibacter helveticus TaxID=357240 RepID=UPI000DA116A4|nr:hypothetical protein [Franconibacter helveticus]